MRYLLTNNKFDKNKLPDIFKDTLSGVALETSTWVTFWGNKEDGTTYLARDYTFTGQNGGGGSYRADRSYTGLWGICARDY